MGAYHFNLFINCVTKRVDLQNIRAIKVFDFEGQFRETFSEKGFGLGQIFHPTGIFVEELGLITRWDIKEENCLQRL